MPEPSDVESNNTFCAKVNPKLAGAIDGGVVLTKAEQSHVSTCLQCQAELARYRKLLRVLHDLRAHVVHPAPGLVAEILDNLGERGEQRAVRSLITGRRVAYTGGIAMAAAAGVAGVILLSGRSRRSTKTSGRKAA